MASLAYLQPYINQIHQKAEALDVPTPVIDAFRDMLIGASAFLSHPVHASLFLNDNVNCKNST